MERPSLPSFINFRSFACWNVRGGLAICFLNSRLWLTFASHSHRPGAPVLLHASSALQNMPCSLKNCQQTHPTTIGTRENATCFPPFWIATWKEPQVIRLQVFPTAFMRFFNNLYSTTHVESSECKNLVSTMKLLSSLPASQESSIKSPRKYCP